MKEFFKYVLATVVGIIAVSVIGFFFFFILIGALISSAEKQVAVSDNSLLTLNLERQILDRAPNDPFEDLEIPGFERAKTIGLDDITKSLEKAVYDDRIKGVYLKLSMINGGMASVEEIRNALIAFKDSCDKPVYAHASQYMMDQKAYYLATVADKIVVHPEVSVDFRGLGGEMMFYKNALEKLGVEMQIIRGPNNKFKAAVEPFMLDKMSDENREQQLTYMGSMWNHMLKGISEKRNISVETLNTLADDVQTFNKGQKIVENGLVDAVKYQDEVLDDLREIAGIKGTKGVPVIETSKYADVPVKGKEAKYSRNKIAVVYASGEIGISLGGETIVGDELGKEIRKVRQDSSYKAIVLRVNSPGGAIFDSETIWREVKLAAEEKTLVVSFGDVAASGGYYISCPADKIVASPNTITGSIGIFGTIPNFGELMNDKLGITTDAVKTNKNSDLLPLTRPMTDYERQLLTQNVAEGYNTFLSHVADGRGMTTEQVDEIGQGRVWSGENAKEIGLIDEFGGINDAIKLAAEIEGLENYRTVSLPALEDPFQELFKMGGNNVRARFLKNELGEKYRYYEYFKKMSEMNGVYARMPFDIYIN